MSSSSTLKMAKGSNLYCFGLQTVVWVFFQQQIHISYYWRYWPWYGNPSIQQSMGLRVSLYAVQTHKLAVDSGGDWKWRDWIPWWMSLQGIGCDLKMIQTDDEQDIFHKGIRILSLHFICSRSIFSFCLNIFSPISIHLALTLQACLSPAVGFCRCKT